MGAVETASSHSLPCFIPCEAPGSHPERINLVNPARARWGLEKMIIADGRSSGSSSKMMGRRPSIFRVCRGKASVDKHQAGAGPRRALEGYAPIGMGGLGRTNKRGGGVCGFGGWGPFWRGHRRVLLFGRLQDLARKYY